MLSLKDLCQFLNDRWRNKIYKRKIQSLQEEYEGEKKLKMDVKFYPSLHSISSDWRNYSEVIVYDTSVPKIKVQLISKLLLILEVSGS
jgi:hypothetical protein